MSSFACKKVSPGLPRCGPRGSGKSLRRPALSRRRGLGFALLVLFLALGCGDSTRTPMRVVSRLVDPELRPAGASTPATLVTADSLSFATQTSPTAAIPSATIADDTRYVLAGHERAVLAYLARITPAAPDRISTRLDVGGAFRGAKQVVLVASAQLEEKGEWKKLPSVLRPIESIDGRRVTTLNIRLPGARPGSEVLLTTLAYRPVGQAKTSYLTPELEIPAGAELEFAMGILEPALSQGAVRFEVDACRSDRCEPLFAETLDPARQGEAGWHDRRISLQDIADARRAFRFTAEQLSAGNFSLPVWANPTVLARAVRRERPPNIILLSIDTLRSDHLDVYGYRRATAPFLRTRLAAEGIVFENLVAEAATTDPSHMTMFTSLPALVHGVHSGLNKLQVPVVTLAEVLRNHGFRTAAFTENGPLAHNRGFAIGFDEYTENKSAHPLQPSGQVAHTFSQARRWLERKADQPFFLFLHTFQVHAPYAPPAAYRRYFAEPTDPDPDRQPESADAQKLGLVADYDREIRYVDDELAALDAWLEGRGLGRNTVWFVLSDHGEQFYEHGSLGHGTLPYEEVLRVPLIAHGPGVVSGVRSSAPLQHVDLMPTILDLVGSPAPRHLQGTSFLALLSGNIDRWVDPERPRFSVSWVLPPGLTPPAFSVRLAGRKLIQYRKAGQERLAYYDLSRDPHERRDLLPEHRAEAEDLRALLSG